MLHLGEQESSQLGPKAFESWARLAVRDFALSPKFKQVVREPLRGCRFSK